jgi:UDP-2,3-diacylglucosamine hydrolase
MSKASPGPLPTEHPSRVYFLADAHLGIESPELEEAKERDLVSFLSALSGRASHLYLVGDLFDFWFEYPTVEPREHIAVLDALSRLSSSGTEIHFLGGNHDYWAGRRLESMTGAAVHRRPLDVTHFGRRMFIAHGDGLPSGDRGYRILKAVLRNPLSIVAFRLLGPRIGRALARWVSALSDVTPSSVTKAIPPMRTFLEEKLAQGYDAAVVGHVHKQLMWTSDAGTSIVVGDWMPGRRVVEMTQEGFRLLTWTDAGLVGSEPT